MLTFPRLAERLSHGGQQLSGGEQQMLSIGRALMTNPLLLILDEATEGLAPLIVAEIWRVIGDIRQTGIATLIVDRNVRAVLATPTARWCWKRARWCCRARRQRPACERRRCGAHCPHGHRCLPAAPTGWSLPMGAAASCAKRWA
jgi:ABC-type Mn2+/Zn2+ transport system ATPase subunit